MKIIFTVEKNHPTLIGQVLQLTTRSGEWQYKTQGQGLDAAILGAQQFDTYEAARAAADQHGARVVPHTEKIVRFAPKQVPGEGWTVVMVVGSKRTGREEFRTEFPNTYTMHQAQIAAESAARDFFQHLVCI